MRRPGLKAALSLAVGGEKTAAVEADSETSAARAPVESVGVRSLDGSRRRWRASRMLALEEDTTLQALMAEAFNDVFTKRGKPPIA